MSPVLTFFYIILLNSFLKITIKSIFTVIPNALPSIIKQPLNTIFLLSKKCSLIDSVPITMDSDSPVIADYSTFNELQLIITKSDGTLS